MEFPPLRTTRLRALLPEATGSLLSPSFPASPSMQHPECAFRIWATGTYPHLLDFREGLAQNWHAPLRRRLWGSRTCPGALHSPYHSIQEVNASQELQPGLAELAEELPPNGLPLTQAAVVSFCKGRESREVCDPRRRVGGRHSHLLKWFTRFQKQKHPPTQSSSGSGSGLRKWRSPRGTAAAAMLFQGSDLHTLNPKHHQG